MEITNMTHAKIEINGGVSGSHTAKEIGIATEVRGIVQSSTMITSNSIFTAGYSNPSIELIINNKKYIVHGEGLVRIDVGEEIILHIGGNHKVVGLQIVRDDKAIFRVRFINASGSHGSSHYHFVK